jgi:hypothetical protein
MKINYIELEMEEASNKTRDLLRNIVGKEIQK